MRQKYFFKESTNADDVFNVLVNNLDSIGSAIPEDEVLYHLSNYSKLNSEEKSRFFSCAKLADRKFSPHGVANYHSHKLLNVLTAISFIHLSYDKVSTYSDEELILLINQVVFGHPSLYLEYIEEYPKDVLEAACRFDSNFGIQEDILFWYGLSIDKGVQKEVLLNRIKNDDKEILKNEAFQMISDFIDEGLFSSDDRKEVKSNDSRRI